MDTRPSYLKATDETHTRARANTMPAAVIDASPPFDAPRNEPRNEPRSEPSSIPAYLSETYNWAYLDPGNVRMLDREPVVWIILWGQHRALQRAAFAELQAGQRVLQPASVYGQFAPNLARLLGPDGHLDVTDVAQVQIDGARRKLSDLPQASAYVADARRARAEHYDAVCCYFLLHEVPDTVKHEVVDALLGSVVPGGKVVFIDYHKPHWAHPLKLITSIVFDTLEPFAKSLWRHEIKDYATDAAAFTWRRQTYFGGLYQKVVAERKK